MKTANKTTIKSDLKALKAEFAAIKGLDEFQIRQLRSRSIPAFQMMVERYVASKPSEKAWSQEVLAEVSVIDSKSYKMMVEMESAPKYNEYER